MAQLENLVSELGSEVSSSARRFLDSLTQAVEKARNGELDLSILARNLDDLNVLLLENGRFPRLDSSLLCRISEEQLSEFTTLIQEFSQQLESENPDYTVISDISARFNAVFRLIFPEPGNKAVADFFVRNLNMAVMEKKSSGSVSNNSLLFVNTLRSYSKNIVKPDSRQDKNRFYNPSDVYAEEAADKYSPPNCYVTWKIGRPVPEKSVISGQDWRFDYNVKLISAFLSHIQFGSEQNSEFPDVRPEETGGCVTSGNDVDAVWSDHQNIGISAIPLNSSGVEYISLDSEINPKRKMTMGESLNVSNIKSAQGWWNKLGGMIMNPRGPLPAGKYRFTIQVYEGLHSYYTVDLGVIEVLPPEAAVPAIKIAKVEIFDQSGATPAVSAKNNLKRIDPLLPQPGRVQLEMIGQGVNNKKYQLELFLKPEDSNFLSGPIKNWMVNGVDFSHRGTKNFDYSIPENELLAMADRNVFVLAKLREVGKKNSEGSEKASEKRYIGGVFVKNWQKCQDTTPKVEKNTSHFGATPEHPLFPEVVECSFELVNEQGKPVISNKLTEVYVEEVIDHLVKEWEDPKKVDEEVKIKHRMYGTSHNPKELGVISSTHPEYDKPYKVNKNGSFDVRFESYAFFTPFDLEKKYNELLEGRIAFFVKMYGKKIYFPLYPDELISNSEYEWGELALQNKQMMMYKQWYNVIDLDWGYGSRLPEWAIAQLEFYIRKMDKHRDIRNVVQYIDFNIGTPLERQVYEDAMKWRVDIRYMSKASGMANYIKIPKFSWISINSYSWNVRRNGRWKYSGRKFFPKTAQIDGDNLFYFLALHEFRHAYQHFLDKKPKADPDSDRLVGKLELEKLHGIKSLGKFCLFGTINSNGECVYGAKNEGHILPTKIIKWSDVGHGFLVDPQNAKYTKDDFNLLPNSSFVNGVKDEFEVDFITDVKAAIEADADLFGVWFQSDPPPEDFVDVNLPKPVLSDIPEPGIQSGSFSVRIVNTEFLQNGIEVLIDDKPCEQCFPGYGYQIQVPFLREYFFCKNTTSGLILDSTYRKVQVRFGNAEKHGPWTEFVTLLVGLDKHPGGGWECSEKPSSERLPLPKFHSDYVSGSYAKKTFVVSVVNVPKNPSPLLHLQVDYGGSWHRPLPGDWHFEAPVTVKYRICRKETGFDAGKTIKDTTKGIGVYFKEGSRRSAPGYFYYKYEGIEKHPGKGWVCR
jgi:hypothetical protein